MPLRANTEPTVPGRQEQIGPGESRHEEERGQDHEENSDVVEVEGHRHATLAALEELIRAGSDRRLRHLLVDRVGVHIRIFHHCAIDLGRRHARTIMV